MSLPPAGVVFDMDGLLLDSERVAREAFEEACHALGLAVPAAVYQRCVGSTAAATAAILRDVLADEAQYRALDRSWDALYQARIDGGAIALKPGAVELLDDLARRRIPRALATSTARPRAEAKLARAGILSRFDGLVCGGETPRGKPHPDPYVAAVGLLGTDPASTWALEDSENGVRAAHAAGLVVIQVPDLVAPPPELAALGHRIVADLFEVRRLL